MKKFVVSLISIFSVLVTLAGIFVALSALLKHRKEKNSYEEDDNSFHYHDDLEDLDDDFDTEYYTIHDSSKEDTSSTEESSSSDDNTTSGQSEAVEPAAPDADEIKTDLDDLLEDFDKEEGTIRF